MTQLSIGLQQKITPEERRTANHLAQALLEKIGAEQRLPNAIERLKLARYSGWGGVGGSLNEYQTPPEIAGAMWKILHKLGVHGRGLEPSANSGTLVALRGELKMTAVEIGKVPAGILKLLAPDVDVQQMSFETYLMLNPDVRFDFSITNPPFGARIETSLFDLPAEKEASRYFLKRVLDRMNPGGLVVAIVPHGVLGNKDSRGREMIAARAQLIAAHGLPTSVFHRAHTDMATTDLLVLRAYPEDVRRVLCADPSIPRTLGLDPEDLRTHFEAHPGRMHAVPGTRSGPGGRPVYYREGELGAALAEALVTETSNVPAHDLHVETMLSELDLHAPHLALKARRALAREDVEEGTLREQNNQLSVYVRGWQRLKQEELPALREACALGATIRVHQDAIALGLDGGAELQLQTRQAIEHYLERHGNPHVGMIGKLKPRDALPLLGAVNASGRITGTLFEQKAVNELSRATLLMKVTRGADIDAAYAGTVLGLNEPAAEQALFDEGYAYTGHTWRRPERYYTGYAAQLLNELPAGVRSSQEEIPGNTADQAAPIATAVSLTATRNAPAETPFTPLQTLAMQGQADRLRHLLSRKTLHDVDLTPRNGSVPLDIIKAYACSVMNTAYPYVRETNFELTRNEQGLKLAWGKGLADEQQKKLRRMTRYLTLAGRRSDEANDYAAWDDEFKPWLEAHNLSEQVMTHVRETIWAQPAYPNTPVDAQIPGWRASITFRLWQNELIHRTLAQGSLIAGLGVGLGKTLSGVGLAACFAQEGGRVMIAVPKSVMSHWRKEFERAIDLRVSYIGARPSVDERGQIRRDENGREIWDEITSAPDLTLQLHEAVEDNARILVTTYKALERIPVDQIQMLGLIEKEFFRQDGGSSAPGYKRPGAMTDAMFEEYAVLKVKMMLEAGEMDEERLQEMGHRLQEVDAELKAMVGQELNAGEKELRAMKQEERERLRFFSRAYASLEGPANLLSIPWHALGITDLIIDEGHNFKNLWVPKNSRVKYLGAAGDSSQRAMDLYFKASTIREKHGRVVMLTATPYKNSPTDVYNLITITNPDTWTRAGINNIDDFLERFCDVRSRSYTNDYGEAVDEDYLHGIKNLTELREIAFQAIHHRTAKDVGLALPTVTPEYVLHPPCEDAEDIIGKIGTDPLRALVEFTGRRDLSSLIPHDIETREEDGRWSYTAHQSDEAYEDAFDLNRLAVLGLTKRAELDLEMIDPHVYKGHVSPKVQALIKDLVTIVMQGGKAVIFCDTVDMPNPANPGRRNPHGYSFHQKLANLIVQATGLRPEQVAVANARTAPTSESRQRIGDDLNAGIVRVIIGNTPVIGEGMNLQDEVGHLRHLDLPDNPAMLEQRSGRVVRQGNDLESVTERFHMGMRGLDANQMDLMHGKRGAYDAFWSGSQDSMESDQQLLIPSREKLRALAIRDDTERAAALNKITERETAQHTEGQRHEAEKVWRRYVAATRELQKHTLEVKADTKHEISNLKRAALETSKQRWHDALVAHPGFEGQHHLLAKPLDTLYISALNGGVEAGTVLLSGQNRVQVISVDTITRSAQARMNGRTGTLKYADLAGMKPYDLTRFVMANVRGSWRGGAPVLSSSSESRTVRRAMEDTLAELSRENETLRVIVIEDGKAALKAARNVTDWATLAFGPDHSLLIRALVHERDCTVREDELQRQLYNVTLEVQRAA